MFISVGQTDVTAGVKIPTKTDTNFYKTDAYFHHSSFYEKQMFIVYYEGFTSKLYFISTPFIYLQLIIRNKNTLKKDSSHKSLL